MKTKTHFAFRIDIWDDTGDSIVEHVAGVDDFEVAEATYRAAVARWPRAGSRCGRASGWPTTTLSKKLHSLPSSIRRIIQTRGYSCTDPRPRPFGSGLPLSDRFHADAHPPGK